LENVLELQAQLRLAGLKWRQLKRAPGVDDSADDIGFAHSQTAHRRFRSRMRYQKYFVPVLLTPDAAVAFVVPYQVDGTFPEGPPERFLNDRLTSIDFNQRSRRDDIGHAVIVEANYGIGKSLGLQAL